MSSIPDFVIKIIEQDWKPGKKILDIGCGPAFLRTVFKEDYIGLDYIDEPYSKNLLRSVDLISQAHDIKLESERVDIVVIKSTLFILPEIDLSIKEAYRVLKRGGVLLVFDYNYRTQKNLMRKTKHVRYPCWTQFGLKQRILKNDFDCCEILSATTLRRASWLQTCREELRGCWAIIRAEKK